jgi:hypothetical protein
VIQETIQSRYQPVLLLYELEKDFNIIPTIDASIIDIKSTNNDLLPANMRRQNCSSMGGEKSFPRYINQGINIRNSSGSTPMNEGLAKVINGDVRPLENDIPNRLARVVNDTCDTSQSKSKQDINIKDNSVMDTKDSYLSEQK